MPLWMPKGIYVDNFFKLSNELFYWAYCLIYFDRENNSKKIEQAYSLLESVRNDLLDIIDNEEEIER